jgi:tRNA pseudouridine55 synthase
VERKERHCTINSFEVWRDVSDPQLAHFRVDCSKGTYVRTLAFDLGKSLGTTAHLTELRRESIGEHSVQDAWTVESLFEACEPQVEDFLAAKEEAEKEAEK